MSGWPDRGRCGDRESDDLPPVLASRPVYAGRIINLRVDEIGLPDGGSAIREVVDHPGAVVVVALDADGSVYLVEQYRHPIGRYLLELPAGCLEPGEEPLVAAKRELREEVGLVARDWALLGSFFSSPGFLNEELHAFLARGLVSVESQPDDDEDIHVLRYPLHEVLDRCRGAADAKTLAALFLLAKVDEQGRMTAT
jgi:8-oxo-dGTP pyrophosphatase MutT (NUDIX family)